MRVSWTASLLILCAVLPIAILFNVSVREYPVNNTGGVIVTGASRGIGFQIVKDLAKETEFIVYAGYRRSEDAENIRKLGLENLIPVELDVTDEASVRKGIDVIREDLKKKGNLSIVGLINNAGVTKKVVAEQMPIEKVKGIFDVNFFSLYTMLYNVLPDIRASAGRIINVSSFMTSFSLPFSSAYAASKSAMEAFSDSLRREMLSFKVSVSVIQPALVTTDMTTSIATLRDLDYGELPEDPYLMQKTSLVEKSKDLYKNMDDPKVVSGAIIHAMTNPYPKTR